MAELLEVIQPLAAQPWQTNWTWMSSISAVGCVQLRIRHGIRETGTWLVFATAMLPEFEQRNGVHLRAFLGH